MKNKPIVFISLIVLLVVIAGAVVYFNPAMQTSLGSRNEGVNIIVRPVFGQLECMPDSNPVRVSTETSIGSSGIVHLPTTYYGDISSLSLTVSLPKASSFGYQRRLRYSICRVGGTSCIIKDKVITQTQNQATSTTLQTISTGYEYSLFYEEDRSVFSTNWVGISGAKYTATYTPYVLYVNDIFNPKRKISATCNHPEYEASDEKLELLTSTSIAGQKARSGYVSKLMPEQFWSYIAGFVVSPYEIETYRNQDAYCSGNTMYGFDTITTSIGNEYLIADINKVLGSVSCCNGDVKLNAVCENHLWKDIQTEEVECSVFKPCPLSTYVVNPNDSQGDSLIKQTCSSAGKCVLLTKDVECTTNNQCKEGETCNEDWKCELTGASGGGEIPNSCGNRICEGNEDYTNCPTDCVNTNTGENEQCKPLIDVDNGFTPLDKTDKLFFVPNPFCEKILYISAGLGILVGFLILGFGYNDYIKPKTKRQKIDWLLMFVVFAIAILGGFLVYYLINISLSFIFSFWGFITGLIILGLFTLYLIYVRPLIIR
jgi:hypothetical protein